MGVELKIGPDAIRSYRRLAYKPWHALAEFVDNSTQSYFDHKDDLDPLLQETGEKLTVRIAYDRDEGFLRISDNAMGMSLEELEHALHVASPPRDTSGRSKYGMGLKTAACWIGNSWTIRTKKLGERVEHTIRVEVENVASGDNDLPYEAKTDRPAADHYTVIEIRTHNQKFQGRTLGKIREFLSSMYREDFRNDVLTLEWQGTPLVWKDIDDRLLVAADGSPYKKSFAFRVDDKDVWGWVGILDKGGRADAGFSIIYRGRVIKGWPDSWRPSSLYGQLQGSNDLVNQRLVGEVHLDNFEVSHTKDDIQWFGSQEEDVEAGLKKNCEDYRNMALSRRKGDDDQRGPTDAETDTAIAEFKKELTSDEMIDQIEIGPVPPQEVVSEAVEKIVESIENSRPEALLTIIGSLTVKIYIESDMSPNDPYVVSETARQNEVVVVVNAAHPHWGQLKGSEGVLNYLRHCTYDAGRRVASDAEGRAYRSRHDKAVERQAPQGTV